MLVSLVIYLVGLVGCSVSDSYGALMACRIIHTISSSVCEALPVQLVNDIFFRKDHLLDSYCESRLISSSSRTRIQAGLLHCLPLLGLDWSALRWLHVSGRLQLAAFLLRRGRLRRSTANPGFYLCRGDSIQAGQPQRSLA